MGFYGLEVRAKKFDKAIAKCRAPGGGIQMSKKEKTPRYQAFSIDGHICRPCCGNTLEELNCKIKHYPKGIKRQPYFVRDNVKEEWI